MNLCLRQTLIVISVFCNNCNQGTTEARDVVPTSEAKWEEHNSLVVYTSSGVRASQKVRPCFYYQSMVLI